MHFRLFWAVCGLLFSVQVRAQIFDFLTADDPPAVVEPVAPGPSSFDMSLGYWSPPDFTTRNAKAMGYDPYPFKTPPGLEKDVQFWIDIYSKYTTHQGVFHLSGQTEQILGEIDLTDVYANPKWGPIRKEKEGQLIIKRQKRLLAQKFGIDNVRHIRLQMGLKDRMQDAIRLSGFYLPMMEMVFEKEKLPLELSRVVFVESSFNIHAGSRVGASGLWQIMPRMGRKFKYITPTYDKRNHAYYSTRVAAKILKQNYRILKSWPLAVTAYNHGVGSLSKLVKKYESNDIAYLCDNAHKKSFGFASRNFYATFLAALHVEKNANLYFPEPIAKFSALDTKDIYLKKKLSYENLLDLFAGDKDRLRLYNAHIYSKFLKKGRFIPPKTLVSLPSERSTRLAEIQSAE